MARWHQHRTAHNRQATDNGRVVTNCDELVHSLAALLRGRRVGRPTRDLAFAAEETSHDGLLLDGLLWRAGRRELEHLLTRVFRALRERDLVQ